LQEARAQGDVLVVGLNSDSSVRALKGKTRPVQQIADRSLILSSLQAVDFVVVFDESTPMHLIQAIRPDVLVKGADYSKEEVVGAQFVESYGGRVHLAMLHHGHSTTNLLERMRAA
jgi:D-beta-D-heptose 7-phosphate kinase/D-beta-D-heptose 1-phosphate adenosyltransferase